MNTPLAVGAAAALLLASVAPLRAQDPGKPAATAPSVLEEALAAPLQVTLTPYLWAMALNGNATVKGIEADVEVNFSDLVQHLNGAVMLAAELRKGRFAIMSDTIYANLFDDESALDDRVKVETTANQLIQSLAGTYRLGTWDLGRLGEAGPLSLTVDPYAGIRYTYLDSEIDGKLDLQRLGISRKRSVDVSKQWIDPVVGLQTIWALGERWDLTLTGDVGGTSTSSDYSWQALGAIGYRFGLLAANDAALRLGYRALHQKFEDGNGRNEFEWDITMHGPIIGLAIRF